MVSCRFSLKPIHLFTRFGICWPQKNRSKRQAFTAAQSSNSALKVRCDGGAQGGGLRFQWEDYIIYGL